MLNEPCWYQQYPQNQKWKKLSHLRKGHADIFLDRYAYTPSII